MAHLRLDDRGYPIPYFATIINGKPDFRLLDARKQKDCVDRKLCSVCGKKLPKDYCYFLSGIMGVTNQVSTDPPMHRACAEYSLAVCPHLHLEKAQRREVDLPLSVLQEILVEQSKPKDIYLIKAKTSNFKTKNTPDGKGGSYPIIHYTLISTIKYSYEGGILVKSLNH